jgi:DNA-binding MarR family transcriptional regulator
MDKSSREVASPKQRGATYKQLKFLSVLAKIPAHDVYELAERVPLSQAMAHHLIDKRAKGG